MVVLPNTDRLQQVEDTVINKLINIHLNKKVNKRLVITSNTDNTGYISVSFHFLVLIVNTNNRWDDNNMTTLGTRNRTKTNKTKSVTQKIKDKQHG